MKLIRFFPLVSVMLIVTFSISMAQDHKVLIFSKTKGFRHNSIEKGREIIADLCLKNGIAVDSTEDAGKFTEKNLKNYSALIFLSTTGDLFNEDQEKALVEYIKNGGGFVGIHAATDAEYQWPWYGKMTGGYFMSHPKQQTATIKVIDKNHPSTTMLPDEWVRWDEWYDFKDLNPDIHILAKMDETTYKGGKMNNDHPIIWFHKYEGGKIFYTGLGHTEKSFTEPLFQQHIMGGLSYVLFGMEVK